VYNSTQVKKLKTLNKKVFVVEKMIVGKIKELLPFMSVVMCLLSIAGDAVFISSWIFSTQRLSVLVPLAMAFLPVLVLMVFSVLFDTILMETTGEERTKLHKIAREPIDQHTIKILIFGNPVTLPFTVTWYTLGTTVRCAKHILTLLLPRTQ
jgi:hypothetical protein